MYTKKVKNKIDKIANDYNQKLLANDKRFNNMVYICHEDCSISIIKNAFLLKIKDDTEERDWWIIVFAEHHLPQVYHTSELLNYFQCKRLDKIETLKV